MKKIFASTVLLSLSACVVAPAYQPPPGYAYEYYPDSAYYYGAPYPAFYGNFGYDWGYWRGGDDGGRWGHGYGDHWRHH